MQSQTSTDGRTTPEQRQELLELAEKIPSPPWEIRRGGNFTEFGESGFGDYCDTNNDSATPLKLGSINWPSLWDVPEAEYEVAHNLVQGKAESVAKFIVAAANLAPGLVRDVERLEKRAEDAERDLAHLRGECAKEPTLERMHFEQGQPLQFDVKHPLVAVMAASLVDAVGDAPNYVEVELTHPEKGAFILMVKRKFGKSPHALRQEAESKVQRLEKAIQVVYSLATRMLSEPPETIPPNTGELVEICTIIEAALAAGEEKK